MKSKMLLTMTLALGFLISACEKGELDASKPGNLVPLTVDQDPTLPSIHVNGAQLHAEAYGAPDSALVIVIHGGPGTDYRHLLNCREIADAGYRVVFYDQRGTGLSQRYPRETYSLQLMIDDLEAVIAHYRTAPNQPVFLFGHSWGAMLATAYINARPTDITGAILAEPGGFTYDQMMDYVSRTRDFGIFSETLSDVVYLDQFLVGGADDHARLDYKFQLQAAADAAEDSPLGNEGPVPAWRLGAVLNQALFSAAREEGFDWTTNLSAFTPNVLFLYSEHNRAYGESHARDVSAPYPNVQLFRVDDAGHDMFSFSRGWQNVRPVAITYLNSLK